MGVRDRGNDTHEKLLIIGAGGHGKVVADIAFQTRRYKNIGFLDDDESLQDVFGIKVEGKSNKALEHIEEADIFIAVGNADIRKNIQKKLMRVGAIVPTLIHPNAVIGKSVRIGEGTVIMAGAVINPDSKIGKGCIINTCASVDHDCRIEDYVHVSVGAHLCGTVTVGEGTWIGAGVMVSNNIDICERCMVGAGAVVVKNISESGVYMGVPAGRSKKE